MADKWDKVVDEIFFAASRKVCKLKQTSVNWLAHPEDEQNFVCETHDRRFSDKCQNGIRPLHCPAAGQVDTNDFVKALRDAYNQGHVDGRNFGRKEWAQHMANEKLYPSE